MEALATLAALLDRTINEVKDHWTENFRFRSWTPFEKKEESLQAETRRVREIMRQEVHRRTDSPVSQSQLQTALEIAARPIFRPSGNV